MESRARAKREPDTRKNSRAIHECKGRLIVGFAYSRWEGGPSRWVYGQIPSRSMLPLAAIANASFPVQCDRRNTRAKMAATPTRASMIAIMGLALFRPHRESRTRCLCRLDIWFPVPRHSVQCPRPPLPPLVSIIRRAPVPPHALH